MKLANIANIVVFPVCITKHTVLLFIHGETCIQKNYSNCKYSILTVQEALNIIWCSVTWFELSPKGQIWRERIMPLHSKWLSLSSVWKMPGLLKQTHWAAQRGTDRFQAIVIMASFHTDGEELNPCVSEALGRRNDIILGFAVSDEDADFGNAVSGPVFRLEAVFLYVAEGQTWKWHRRDASISAPPLSCLSVTVNHLQLHTEKKNTQVSLLIPLH